MSPLAALVCLSFVAMARASNIDQVLTYDLNGNLLAGNNNLGIGKGYLGGSIYGNAGYNMGYYGAPERFYGGYYGGLGGYYGGPGGYYGYYGGYPYAAGRNYYRFPQGYNSVERNRKNKIEKDILSFFGLAK